MERENRLIFNYLHEEFGTNRLSSIYQSFKDCSKDRNSGTNLVSNQTKTINFDKLVKWLYKNVQPKSADSLSFSRNWVYLIEFKKGNCTKGDTRRRILQSAEEKIVDSERIILEKLAKPVPEIEEANVRLKFFLVVTAKEVGPNAEVYILAKLSEGAKYLSLEEEEMVSRINEIKEEMMKRNSSYDDIDLWYSDVFDLYLQKEGIEDITKIEFVG